MDQVTCPNCRAQNVAGAAFCSSCGTALAAAGSTPAPSGWDLATAGMSQPPAIPSGHPGSALTKDECAGWWQRLGGYLLDAIIQFVAIAVIWGVVGGLAYALDADFADNLETFFDATSGSYEEENAFDAMTGWVVVLFLLSVVFSLGWEILWLRSKAMAKPGQFICGFRIVRASDAQPLGTGRAIGRTASKFLYYIPNIGFLVTIASAFTIGLTEKKQSLHDLIAGTTAIRKSALTRRGIGPDAAALAGNPLAPPSMGLPYSPPAPPTPSSPGPSTPGSGHSGAMPPYTPPPSGSNGPFV